MSTEICKAFGCNRIADIDTNVCLDCLNESEGECCTEWNEGA